MMKTLACKRVIFIGTLIYCSFFTLAAFAAASNASPKVAKQADVPRIIISTDIANGIISTHGAQGSSPVAFSNTATYLRDSDISPQDVDDGFTLAMALNLDAAGLVDVDPVIPTYGNAPYRQKWPWHFILPGY